MTDITIRRAGTSDAERLAHIGAATFLETYVELIDGNAMVHHCTHQHSAAVYAAWLADPAATVWLAEYTATGAPIGYAVNCPPDLPVILKPGDVELKRIYSLSRFHGSGTGRRMMEAAIEDARTRNAPRLLLGTYKDNHRAIDFYTKAGFDIIGTRRFQVGDKWFDDLVLAKPL